MEDLMSRAAARFWWFRWHAGIVGPRTMPRPTSAWRSWLLYVSAKFALEPARHAGLIGIQRATRARRLRNRRPKLRRPPSMRRLLERIRVTDELPLAPRGPNERQPHRQPLNQPHRHRHVRIPGDS